MGMGDEGSASNSRKGKKSSSKKPKQPQRGLGVARLEQLRLETQMAASCPPSLNHHPLHTKEDDVLGLGIASSPSSSTYTAAASRRPFPLIHPNTMMAASYPPSLNHHPLHIKEEDVLGLGIASSPSSSTYTAAASPQPFPLHPNTMMGYGEGNRRTDVRYDEFQHSSSVRPYLDHNNEFIHQYSVQRPVTLPLLQQDMEDSAKKRRHDRSTQSMGSMSQNSNSSDSQSMGSMGQNSNSSDNQSMGSMGQNSNSSDTQELDLDLKL